MPVISASERRFYFLYRSVRLRLWVSTATRLALVTRIVAIFFNTHPVECRRHV